MLLENFRARFAARPLEEFVFLLSKSRIRIRWGEMGHLSQNSISCTQSHLQVFRRFHPLDKSPAGAGFGFLEAMLYGVGGVHQSGTGTWWVIMLVRTGSTSLHVLNTSLVGLAWWYASFGREKRRGWLLFGLAVALHALWNGFAIVLDSRILGLETVSHEILTFVAYGVVAVLSVSFMTAIPLIARRLRESQDAPLASEL